jgi:hypothetical protein
MAASIGPGFKRQITIRPVFARTSKSAFSSTSRCLLIAGSEMPKGAAISPTLISGLCARNFNISRRVGSESAENVESSVRIII